MKPLLLCSLAATIAAPAMAATDTAPGVETVISRAGNGALRNWVPAADANNIVFVQDGALHWYRVTLTGNCLDRHGNDTVSYTTDGNGRFDRFSRVTTLRFPTRMCG